MTNAQNAANPLCYNFAGRKPSKRQALAKVKQLDDQGADFISLTWGENWTDLSKDANGYWHGYGFLKDVDGTWLARELNHCPKKALAKGFGDPVKFMREHFTIIHVK